MSSEFRLLVRWNDGVPEFDQHIRAAQQGSARLDIPQSIKYAGALGRSIAFAQFVASWAATHTTHSIETKLPNGRSDDLERFVSRIHGLTAAYYANQIIASDGETNLRAELLKAAKPRISAMSERRFADAARGPMTEFVFVNGEPNEFHSAVYKNTPTMADLMDPERHGELIVSPLEMNALVYNTLRAQNLPGLDFGHLAPLLDNPQLPLGHLLHETFRNSAEHAYVDVSSRRIPTKGLRCILIGAHSIQPDALQRRNLVSTDHPHVDAYFKGLRNRAGRLQSNDLFGPRPPSRNLVHILEISVLDTGPGLAATIRPIVGEHMDDVACVEECFRDHVSSKAGENSGLGLGRVLTYVDSLVGYLRIRTSTVEASFFSSPSRLSKSPPTPSVVGDLPDVIGTALTIAIPLVS